MLTGLADHSYVKEDIIVENVHEYAYNIPPIWLSDDLILYNARDLGMVEFNLKSRKMTAWNIRDFFPLNISQDRRLIFGWDRIQKNALSMMDVQHRERIPIRGFQPVHDDIIMSPDGQHIVYTKAPIFSLDFGADTPDVYVFSLNTGKSSKIIKLTDIHGGFWLPEGVLS